MTRINLPTPDNFPTPKTKFKVDKNNHKIFIDTLTILEKIPKIAWEYCLGNRSALEWVLDQYKEKKPKDKNITEKFNTYCFANYKETVIDLLQKVCTVSVETMKIIQIMETWIEVTSPHFSQKSINYYAKISMVYRAIEH